MSDADSTEIPPPTQAPAEESRRPPYSPPQPPRRSLRSRLWKEAQRLFLVLLGALVISLSYTMFQVPHQIAAGGIGGISIIINSFTGWPFGLLFLVMNLPLLILGFFHLGRWPFVIRTLVGVVIFSTATDLFLIYLPDLLPAYPLTDDILLSAIYGGLVSGVGGGLVYRSGSTIGGTGIIGRIIQKKTGFPLSQVYLYTDGLIVLTAGAVFGWERALYALLTLFLSGMASDYTLEGPSSVRTATIITNYPEAMAHALMVGLGHGVSRWQITGSYTGANYDMLTCTIYRPQVNDLKWIVASVDPQAFLTIGAAHQAFGSGFVPLSHS